MTNYYGGYYQPYNQPMPDQLMQLRGSQPMQNPQQFAPQPVSNMIWVQGETGAKSYIVANGNTVPLWDSESPTIYIKTVDTSGMPSMRVFDYTERVTTVKPPIQTVQAPAEDYITRKEYDALAARVNALETPPKRGKSKEEAE